MPGVQRCLLGGLPGRVRAPGLDRLHSAAFYSSIKVGRLYTGPPPLIHGATAHLPSYTGQHMAFSPLLSPLIHLHMSSSLLNPLTSSFNPTSIIAAYQSLLVMINN